MTLCYNKCDTEKLVVLIEILKFQWNHYHNIWYLKIRINAVNFNIAS